MKCYFASSVSNDYFPVIEACFSPDLKQAKKLFWGVGDMQAECDGDYFDMRVVRVKQHDHLYDATKVQPYLVRNEDTLREMGWLFEGDEGYIDL